MTIINDVEFFIDNTEDKPMPEKFCMICEHYRNISVMFTTRNRQRVEGNAEHCYLNKDIKKYYDDATNCNTFELTDCEY